MVTSDLTPERPSPRGILDAEVAPREALLDTIAAQVVAIDELIDLARLQLQVFDRDLSQGGWQGADRIHRLEAFLRHPGCPKLHIIVHDTRWIETSAPRLLDCHRRHSHAIKIYRTGIEARAASDPLVIADGMHFLHRFHADQPRASLVIANPALARPLSTRFDEIWATGEPGISATVLGL